MIEYFLNNRTAAFMVLLALITAGVVSARRLPLSLMPSEDFPAISVLIKYPGVGPEKIESVLTKPVERIMKTLTGISHIESSSEEGKCRINIVFADDVDVRMGAVKVREKIGLLSGNFPEEVQNPIVFRYNPSDRPVFIAALKFENMESNEVRDYVEKRIKPSLQRIEEVSDINAVGGMIKEIKIEADRNMLQGRYTSLDDVASVVKRGNLSIPSGILRGGGKNRNVSVMAAFTSLEEIGNISVFRENGNSIKVSDLAEVSWGFREREDFSRYNGNDLVSLYVYMGSGGNSIKVCSEVRSILASFDNLSYSTVYNQGNRIESALINAALSCLWGMFIVFVLLGLFYRRVARVIPIALSIPASVAIVPLFLFLGGKGLNIMSLSGFALATGMVVDNGIVVMDTMAGDGKGAVSSVKNAVISSTVTTIAVFGPLLFLNRSAAISYGDMAFTVTWALLVSLFMALVLIPVFYLSIKDFEDRSNFSFSNGKIVSEVRGVIKNFEIFLYNNYRVLLTFSFRNREKVLFGVFLCFFASLILFSLLKIDVSSERGAGEFHIYLELPPGTPLSKTDRAVKDLEKALKNHREIKSISSKVEKWRGTITVHTEEGTGIGEEFRNNIRVEGNTLLKDYGGFVYLSGTDALSTKEVTLNFFGDDLSVLTRITKEAAVAIGSIDGINQCLLRYREGCPEYKIEADRLKVATTGTDIRSIADTLRNSLFGPVIAKFISKDREVDVRLRLAEKDRSSIDEILMATVKSRHGDFIPISEVALVKEKQGSTRLYRQSGKRCLSISAIIGSLSFQESLVSIEKIMDGIDIPPEYTFSFDRSVNMIKNKRKSLIISIVISVVLVYMILASLFESLRVPFLIMTSMPLALAGTAPVLYLTSTPLTPSVYLGFVVLTGIVVNNGIILVNSINNIKDYSRDIVSVLIDATLLRFRPVMITTATTVIGLIPLLLTGGNGSSLWRPFAITVSSGLFFSTALTLIVLPLMSISFFKKVKYGKTKI